MLTKALALVVILLAILLAGCGGSLSRRPPLKPATPSQLPPAVRALPDQVAPNASMVFTTTTSGWMLGGPRTPYTGPYSEPLFPYLAADYPTAILATADAGSSWTTQYQNPQGILGLQFLSSATGWAVALDALVGTTDGGAKWVLLSEPSTPLVAVDFLSRTTGWGVTRDNALVSTQNGGASWSTVVGVADVTAVCFTGPSTGYVTTGRKATSGPGIALTRDGGASWTTSYQVPAGNRPGWGELGCDGTGVWALFDFGSEQGAEGYFIVRSLDSGTAWQMVAGGQPGGKWPGAPQRLAPLMGPFQVVTPTTVAFSGVCACGTESLYLTTDGGSAFRSVKVPMSGAEPSLAGLAFRSATAGWVLNLTTPTGQLVAGGPSQEAVFRTTTGGNSWEQVSTSPLYP